MSLMRSVGLWDLNSLRVFRWPLVRPRCYDVIKFGWMRLSPHHSHKFNLDVAKKIKKSLEKSYLAQIMFFKVLLLSLFLKTVNAVEGSWKICQKHYFLLLYELVCSQNFFCDFIVPSIDCFLAKYYFQWNQIFQTWRVVLNINLFFLLLDINCQT